MLNKNWIVFALLFWCIGLSAGTAHAQADKPNIVARGSIYCP
jgi:hypothetical protein